MNGLIFVGILFTELILLFLFSISITKTLGRFFYSLIKNKRITVYILSLIFLPGTIIHELSHFFTAIILFVRVGNINIFPIVEEDGIQLGSVQIEKADIIRRIIIGLAPVATGTLIIIASLWFFRNGLFTTSSIWQTAIFLYLIFAISNTMFSSKKDLEGALVFFVTIFTTIIILFAVLYFTNHFPSFTFVKILNSNNIIDFLKKAETFMLIPIGIDSLIFIISRIFKRS